jgi:hypothetical protein
MKRILVFSSRDWLDPKAGSVEHYVHAVFRWIAAQGNLVVWVSHQAGFLPLGGQRRPRIEIVDDMQIVRLGLRPVYRRMTKLLLSRLQRTGKLGSKFDVLVDVIDGLPLPLPDGLEIEVLPLVFRLDPRVAASEQPPGPVIAATKHAAEQIARAGFPRRHIILAPFGASGAAVSDGEAPAPKLVIIGGRPVLVRRALRILQQKGDRVHVSWCGVRRGRRAGVVKWPHDCDQEGSAWGGAWIVYCGVGSEWSALEAGASGLPVICPATAEGREFVEHGETGLLVTPDCPRELADCLHLLIEDSTLRTRLAGNARRRAQETTWNQTAGLILAAIENLQPSRPSCRPPW